LKNYEKTQETEKLAQALTAAFRWEYRTQALQSCNDANFIKFI